MDPELERLLREADDASRQRAAAWERLRMHPDDNRRRIEHETWQRIEFERREAVNELRARLEGRAAGGQGS